MLVPGAPVEVPGYLAGAVLTFYHAGIGDPSPLSGFGLSTYCVLSPLYFGPRI